MPLCPSRSSAAIIAAMALAFLWSAPPTARADAGHGNGFAGGQPGEPGEVDRTVRIEAKDMRFDPAAVGVEDGETVRFVVHNADGIEHDFTIGTPKVQAQHREEMEAMYGSGAMGTMHGGADHGAMMEGGDHHQGMTGGGGGMTGGAMTGNAPAAAMAHDDPNAVFVPPGATRELIWRFDRTQDLEFACNVPGHYEAGMTGAFRFEPQ